MEGSRYIREEEEPNHSKTKFMVQRERCTITEGGPCVSVLLYRGLCKACLV
jgi:hypothetical protein